MTFQQPRWLPWIGPVLAALAAWLIGPNVLGGGFFTTVMVALMFGFMPLVAWRVWKRFGHKA